MRVCLLILIASVAIPGAVFAAAPVVMSFSPVSQQINASRGADIVVNFSEILDTMTVTSETFRVFGRWSGPATGTFQFEASGQRVRFDPSADFFAGEWVTVSISKGVKAANGTPMTVGYTWNFWAKTDAGTLDFTFIKTVDIRQNAEAWIQSYGAYAGDLNNDGWSDLSIPNEIPADIRIFLNDGTGDYNTFVVDTLIGASSPSANEGADFNHDGEIDLVVASGGNDQITILRGDGTGNFTGGTQHTAASTVKGVGVIDLNGDGWDDIVSSNRFGNNISTFLNDGAGNFPASGTNIETGGANEFSCVVADANNDGIQDVFVGCFNSFEVRLMLGDGLGGLTFSAAIGIGGRPWMLAQGDVNGDGNVDVVAANSFNDNIGVAYGDGAGGFISSTTYPTGQFPLAIDLGDIDGDNDLDLVTSNFDGISWTVYENVNGTFMHRQDISASSAGSCAILHDRDNDGDLDLSGIDELDDLIFIFDNILPPTRAGRGPAPQLASLAQNRPNPFNPTTSITFRLKTRQYVKLEVIDVQGRIIRRLVDRAYAPGEYEARWNGTDVEGNLLRSGVYFYRLITPTETFTRKMTLVK